LTAPALFTAVLRRDPRSAALLLPHHLVLEVAQTGAAAMDDERRTLHPGPRTIGFVAERSQAAGFARHSLVADAIARLKTAPSRMQSSDRVLGFGATEQGCGAVTSIWVATSPG
jgi:hypothetical protein